MSANEIFFRGHDNVIYLQYIYDGDPYKFLDQGATDLHIVLKSKESGIVYTKTKVANVGVVLFDNNGNIELHLGAESDIPKGAYDVTGIVKGVNGASRIIIDKNIKKSQLKIKAIDA